MIQHTHLKAVAKVAPVFVGLISFINMPIILSSHLLYGTDLTCGHFQVLHLAARASMPMSRAQEVRPRILSHVPWDVLNTIP